MRTVFQVDAFTDRLFAGNPAGVVLGADGLDDATMQAIARELHCSETAFVMAPSEAAVARAGATHRVRFFTPACEVPVCGHATVATFHVLTLRGAAQGRAVMECKAGDLPVQVDRTGARAQVTLTLRKAAFVEAPFRGVVSQSVGLPPDAIAPKPAPALVSVGEWIAILPVLAPDVLLHCAPNAPKIRGLGGTRAVTGVYAVALDSDSEVGPVSRARARFFGAEGSGIVEDPATGVAAGSLAAWLAKLGRLAPGEALVVEQGIECGRPSTLVARAGQDGCPSVTGTAVTAFETTLDV